jgi:hypothetical protein
MTRYDIILGKFPSIVEIASMEGLINHRITKQISKRLFVSSSEDFIITSLWRDRPFIAVGAGMVGLSINEIMRKRIAPENIVYIDFIGNQSLIPTNIIEYSCTFLETEAVGILNVIALLSASGDTLCYKLFEVIDKTPSMSLTVYYRIAF